MRLSRIDATSLVAIAEMLRESASLYRTLSSLASDRALRHSAAERSTLRQGLYSELMIRASLLVEPERVASAEYLAILKCLVRGEIALTQTRLEGFDRELVNTIARSIARGQVSAETTSVLRLVAPLLFPISTPQEETLSRGAPR